MPDLEPLAGVAAGVPYVASPPAGGTRPDAPVIVAWHPLDPPRTETALAAALPMTGVDAWRIYLGLPLSGSRFPEGGFDAAIELVRDDIVLKAHGPITDQAVREFGPALAEVRSRLGIDEGPLGLFGGSLGGTVAMLVMAEADVDVAAAVLVNPLVQVRTVVEAIGPLWGFEYRWSDESDAVAKRLDLIARADELRGTPVRVVSGENDLADAFQEPARRLVEALDGSAELVTIPGMGHGFAEEPGLDPAPQNADAAEVERQATDWFVRHLG